MRSSNSPATTQPRYLRFRSHYRIYLLLLILVSFLIAGILGYAYITTGWQTFFSEYSYELVISGLYFLFFVGFYHFWLSDRINRSIQVFPTHILIHNNKKTEELKFSEIESVGMVCLSLFYFKLKSGFKFYFNSSLERVDYVWEGVRFARPDLLSPEEFENFRLKLVQYDHHQKRKEWFFKHKLVDVLNWVIVPLCFLYFAYNFQSKEVFIYSKGIYFFRLFMYSLLVLLVTSFFYSMILKKLIFDSKLKQQLEEQGEKLRDLEFEGIVLHRSKVFQFFTIAFILGFVIKVDMNLYSVTKINSDIANTSLKKGKAVLVDNRYNCINCRYQLTEGDVVVFSRGHIGQVMAMAGDTVGEIIQDKQGRMIASENLQLVPMGHVALKASNGKDIVFVRIDDLIGKIQK